MARKKYEKPQIIIENFSLVRDIAAGCEMKISTQSEGVCAMNGTGGITIFNSSIMSACDYSPTDMGGKEDEWDGFCYHVPVDSRNVFNS